MNNKMIVTLDGPAGVGKSTLAQQLAEKLNIPFLDTGAMFRFIALMVSKRITAKGIEYPQLEKNELLSLLSDITYSLSGSGTNSAILCNGIARGSELRTDEISRLASNIATIPEIREFLKEKQQELGKRFSLVAEGRDMGTVIFPTAFVKFFLDAAPLIRAQRRQIQLQEQGINEPLNDIEKAIVERDNIDRNRAIAPLKPAHDAIIIDTGEKTIDEVLLEMIQQIEHKKII